MEGKYPEEKHADEKQADVLVLERPHTGERPLTEEEKIASDQFEKTMGRQPTKDELKGIMGLSMSQQRDGSSWDEAAAQITRNRRREQASHALLRPANIIRQRQLSPLNARPASRSGRSTVALEIAARRADAQDFLRKMRRQNKALSIMSSTSKATAAALNSPKRNEASVDEVLLAADSGNMKKMVKLLKEVDASQAVGMNLFTPLHHACNRGHLFIAKLLIDHKCDVNAQNKSLETPLHLAAFNGHMQVAELLLDRHARCDALNQYEETPLFYAGRKGHEHMLRLLLQWGADSRLKNRFGESAEDEASTDKSKAVFQTASREIPKGFASLPGLEVLRVLFSFMEVRDLSRSGCICSRWRRHADAKELWDALGVRKWQVALQHTLTGFSAPAMQSLGMSLFARPPRPPGEKRRSFRKIRSRPASSEAPKSPAKYSRNRRIVSR